MFSAVLEIEYTAAFGPLSEAMLPIVLLMFMITRLLLKRNSGSSADETSAGPATFVCMTLLKFSKLNEKIGSSRA